MNMLVAALTFVPLLSAALVHFMWAGGSTWPTKSEEELANTVVGDTGTTRMPNRVLIFAVAVLILVAGILALALADPDSGGLMLTAIGGALALIFAARGGVAYTPLYRRRVTTEPFATLDRKYYAPLCLWIGAGFLVLIAIRAL